MLHKISRAALAFTLLLATPAFAQGGPPVPPINYQTRTLANGLRVVVHTDRKAPIVAVSDIVLTTAARETTFRTGAMASRVSQLVVVDYLPHDDGTAEPGR